jgi:hypothetical protein
MANSYNPSRRNLKKCDLTVAMSQKVNLERCLYQLERRVGVTRVTYACDSIPTIALSAIGWVPPESSHPHAVVFIALLVAVIICARNLI